MQLTIDGSNFGTPAPLMGGGSIQTVRCHAGLISFTAASGSHVISAHYVNSDGDLFRLPATQVSTLPVGQATTNVSDVSSSLNPSVIGQTVTLTAQVSAVSPGAGTPTGMITFSDQQGVLGAAALSSGVATLPIGTLDVAHSPHTITASYAGDTNFLGSNDTGGMPLH